jgi:hypothetical protein
LMKLKPMTVSIHTTLRTSQCHAQDSRLRVFEPRPPSLTAALPAKRELVPMRRAD